METIKIRGHVYLFLGLHFLCLKRGGNTLQREAILSAGKEELEVPGIYY